MLIDPYTWHAVKITHLIHDGIAAIHIHVSKPSSYTFRPGQHAIVRIRTTDGTAYVRQYSYSSSAEATGIRFTIYRSKHGVVSSWFIDVARVNDTIEISQPFSGPLMINAHNTKKLGMIAGGSGIAPLLSWAAQLRRHSPDTPITVIHSTRGSTPVIAKELRSYKHAKIIIHDTSTSPRLSPEEITTQLRDCDTILICGSRSFVQALHAMCLAYMPHTALYCEAFSL